MDNAKKQNILIVHNYYQIPGGEDTVVANEKKMLEKHCHKVILYSRNNAELKQMSKLQKVFLPITTVFNPRTYRDIKKLIRDEKIEGTVDECVNKMLKECNAIMRKRRKW